MKRTYIITRGQQYDQGGASVVYGRHETVARYAADGSYDCGDPVALDDAEMVAEAVRRVITTGQAMTLTLGRDPAPLSAEQVAANRRLSQRMTQWGQTDV